VEQVEELFRVDGYVLICLYHKTFTTYGEAGKYIPPTLLRVMKIYHTMRKWVADEPGFDKESFYLIGRPYIAKLLVEFGPTMGLTDKLVSSTFLRKVQVTSVGELACQPT
jgi:hypothetical protein